MPPRARLVSLAALTSLAAGCQGAPVVTTSAPVAGAAATTAAVMPSSRIERLDPALDALVPADARVEKLAEGFDWVEGPVWRRDKGYLLFSDIPKNTIYKWKDGEGVSVFLRPAGYAGPTPQGRELGTNGLTTDARGALVVADHGNRMIARVSDSLFTKTVLADRYDGKRFNSPNDLIYRSNGDLYFTDPPYGLFKLNEDPAKELPFNGIYRVTPTGTVTLLARDLTFPNGIALSPDGGTLYVALSDGQNPFIWAYDVTADGVANKRVFFDARPLIAKGLRGHLDGMKVDARGNVFATGPGGVVVLSPQGRHLGTIVVGDISANVAFGGDDGSILYMTSNHALTRVRTSTKGLGF